MPIGIVDRFKEINIADGNHIAGAVGVCIHLGLPQVLVRKTAVVELGQGVLLHQSAQGALHVECGIRHFTELIPALQYAAVQLRRQISGGNLRQECADLLQCTEKLVGVGGNDHAGNTDAD